MSIWRNDPKINRKYNYLYKIVNLLNGNFYIGVHRTDNLNDSYMGSGVILKRAIKKHGIENFKKEILEFFDNYEDLLKREKEIINEEMLNDKKCYNAREGGYGNCSFPEHIKKKLSKIAKKRWENEEYKEMMQEKCYNKKRNAVISQKIKKWIDENPEKHHERMMKINKNPEKIKKMADTHRGMKRSDEAKKNISEAAKKNHKKNPLLCGRGCFYIHNPNNGEIKRLKRKEEIPDGWLKGFGPRKNKKNG